MTLDGEVMFDRDNVATSFNDFPLKLILDDMVDVVIWLMSTAVCGPKVTVPVSDVMRGAAMNDMFDNEFPDRSMYDPVLSVVIRETLKRDTFESAFAEMSM